MEESQRHWMYSGCTLHYTLDIHCTVHHTLDWTDHTLHYMLECKCILDCILGVHWCTLDCTVLCACTLTCVLDKHWGVHWTCSWTVHWVWTWLNTRCAMCPRCALDLHARLSRLHLTWTALECILDCTLYPGLYARMHTKLCTLDGHYCIIYRHWTVCNMHIHWMCTGLYIM